MSLEASGLYIIPEIDKNRFTCPYCNTLAEQKWDECTFTKCENVQDLNYRNYSCLGKGGSLKGKKVFIKVSTCQSCFKPHIWLNNKMVEPINLTIPLANDEMPEKVKEIYNEAREVFPVSAKASAALLRLALQYLCIELGEKGKNINTDIGEMVKKGLPVQIQQALDIVRVVGNNAVHPGELDLDDNRDNTRALFDIVNFIVNDRIVRPKEIQKFYNSLPGRALSGIKNRDK
ncbi:DUF4145 domain-containing protein [Clostridium baratii]|uniref:DUF4145 domain-containing protein n=1 Tax=Clostridium baratii TaxID=1561 RepID=UPI002913BCC2|nr:DUF4145 domain-containing protein [Clostridium baratii]MDU4910570.1 DUF4145 domain-containing protein [Clostridium baratii]